MRLPEIDGGVRREGIDRSVFCGAPGATTACGSGIDPRLSISTDFFCSFSFSERKGGALEKINYTRTKEPESYCEPDVLRYNHA